jgi:hypothetical protein
MDLGYVVPLAGKSCCAFLAEVKLLIICYSVIHGLFVGMVLACVVKLGGRGRGVESEGVNWRFR